MSLLDWRVPPGVEAAHRRCLGAVPVPLLRQLLFLSMIRRRGDFKQPTTFNEKVNWRILNDRRDRIIAAFDDLRTIAENCPRGCRHDDAAPECALDTAVANGKLAPARLASFRRMLGSGQ